MVLVSKALADVRATLVTLVTCARYARVTTYSCPGVGRVFICQARCHRVQMVCAMVMSTVLIVVVKTVLHVCLKPACQWWQ